MKRRIYWKLIGLCFVILPVIGYCLAYINHAVDIDFVEPARQQTLAEIGRSLSDFCAKHRRWPDTQAEFDKLKIDDMEIGKYYGDFLSRHPLYLAGGGAYYSAIVGGQRHQVFVMLPQPYRTRLWPFGHIETVIVASDCLVYVVSPDAIHDRSGNVFIPKQQR